MTTPAVSDRIMLSSARERLLASLTRFVTEFKLKRTKEAPEDGEIAESARAKYSDKCRNSWFKSAPHQPTIEIHTTPRMTSILLVNVPVLSKDHVFRVTCQHLPGEGACAALAVRAQDWHLALTLALGTSRLVHVQRLSRDFTTTEPLDLMVRLAFGERFTSRDVVVDAALISFPNDGNYCPVLPLGKIRLDVLSFIEPDNSLSIQSAPTSKLDYLSDVLQCHKLDTFDKANKRDHKDWKVLIKLPKVPTGGVGAFEKIASKSQALWRLESWNKNICCENRWSAAVSGSKISFEVKGDNLELSGDNLSLVVQLKHAILRLNNQSPNFLTISDEKALTVAEDILKNLEIMTFSLEELPVSNVLEIYSRKMKLLNDQFYDTVFHIN